MTAPAARRVGGGAACPTAARRDYIAGQVAELHADFTPDADVADAELRRFGGYVEPGDDGWDLLREVRDGFIDKLLRVRNRRGRLALVLEAEAQGLFIDDDGEGADGGEAV